ncbi:hypothetical protein LUZ60_013981 [Juncus effusus]|nr:hypothetical protein LUZ60_013981 [Juncus effusus]
MERPALLRVMALMCLLCFCQGREIKIKTIDDKDSSFNHTLALTLVEYASAVYATDLTALFDWTCDRCCNLTTGFEVIELIVDISNCLQAFVGVASDPNAIIIAIRGTQENSIQNWICDFVWQELDLPDMAKAKVHRGLYTTYNNTILRSSIAKAVKKIRKSYGDLTVMATGHSMGGALAAFCVFDLSVNHGIDNVYLMTFGQPRIGNKAFATYFEKYVPNSFRIVHNRDIVPHLPPYYPLFPNKNYHHFPTEVWLHDGEEKVCDGSGEDPTCSRSVWITSITDHFTYYGIDMESDDWSTCRIITETEYSSLPYRLDNSGNIIVSKDQSTPLVIRPISQVEVA